MDVKCLCIIYDVVLDSIVKGYLSKTPFLSIENGDVLQAVDHYDCDIIIIEYCHNMMHIVAKISEVKSKPFMILSDSKLGLQLKENVIVIPKNISYSKFIDALSRLMEEYNNSLKIKL